MLVVTFSLPGASGPINALVYDDHEGFIERIKLAGATGILVFRMAARDQQVEEKLK